MQIECTTAISAAQVLYILIDAHLWPGRDFQMAGPRSPDPPIRFTLSVNLSAGVVRQLQGIRDILIAGERGA